MAVPRCEDSMPRTKEGRKKSCPVARVQQRYLGRELMASDLVGPEPFRVPVRADAQEAVSPRRSRAVRGADRLERLKDGLLDAALFDIYGEMMRWLLSQGLNRWKAHR